MLTYDDFDNILIKCAALDRDLTQFAERGVVKTSIICFVFKNQSVSNLVVVTKF